MDFSQRANAISCEKAQVEATLFVFRNPRNSNWTALIASRVKRRLISAEGEVQLNPKNSVDAADTATPATMAKTARDAPPTRCGLAHRAQIRTARKKPGWEQSQPGLNFCDASVPRGDVRVAR